MEAYEKSFGGRAAFRLRLDIAEKLRSDSRSFKVSTAEKIGMALSLAGSLDMSLAGEVARMETSICRHVLLLRKLVLRYGKALIIFVWTTIIMLIASAMMNRTTVVDDLHTGLIYIQAIFLFWALSCVYLLRLPKRWIQNLIELTSKTDWKIMRDMYDADIKEFERITTYVLLASAASSIVAILFEWRSEILAVGKWAGLLL
jgi:hypothetical protein